ncbi:uncharacterized protein LOC120332790 [Styela clava]
MKVICAGMSKCGTKSMHVALEELGYTVCDFPDAFVHFVKNYMTFASKGWNSDEFRSMYEDFDACVASPAYYFWEELVEEFPEAKVILMVRDSDEIWYKSIRKQRIVGTGNGLHRYYYPLFSTIWRKFAAYLNNPCLIAFGPKTTGIFNFLTNHTLAVLPFKLAYRKHIAHVTHSCPKDRLLIIQCKSDWKPLCEFLDKPIPTKPYPWINKDGELANILWEMPFLKQARREMLTNVTILSAGILLLGIYLVRIK